MIWLVIPVNVVFWLIGGQFWKAGRRYGIPLLTIAILYIRLARMRLKKGRRDWIAPLAMLPAIGVLSMGYGVNSWLKGVCRYELTTRIAYAIILSIPLAVYALISPNVSPKGLLITTPALILAFQFRDVWLGKLRHIRIGKFDILLEDVARSVVFGGSIVFLTI